MSADLDRAAAASTTQDGSGGITVTIRQQIERRPLVALGLSIVAGSMLSEMFSGSASSSASTTTSSERFVGSSDTSDSSKRTVADTVSQAGSKVGDNVAQAADAVGDKASNVASSTADAATSAGRSVADATSSAFDSVVDAVQSAAQSTSNAAKRATGAIGGAADKASDSTSSASDTASEGMSNATTRLADTARNVGPSVQRQVREHPLAALGVAMGLGALAQPVAAPHVGKAAQSVSDQFGKVGEQVSSSLPMVKPEEVDRIRVAFVPATVERARKLTNREFREYLEKNLESIVTQTSLRAGVVAAVTEKTEEMVDNRLPSMLERNMSGARGMLIATVVAQILKARNESQQGQGSVITLIRTEASDKSSQLGETTMQNTTDELQRYFPEFRERYEEASPQ